MVILLIISILLIGIGAGVYDSGSLGLGLFLFVVWLVVGWVKDANSPEGRKRANKLTREQKKFENEYGIMEDPDDRKGD